MGPMTTTRKENLAPDPEIERLRQLVEHPEDLHPDLEACKYTTSDGWVMIKHPLVNTVMHAEAFNALTNRQYEYKKISIARALADREWGSYTFLHERPWRLNAFIQIMDNVGSDTYWHLLGQVWVDSENIRETAEVWETMLKSKRPQRASIMTLEERQALMAMPEILDVWQGCTAEQDDGWSWTLDHDKAIWFAERFASFEGPEAEPVVRRGMVSKRKVLAYFDRRNESEILVAPEFVKEISL